MLFQIAATLLVATSCVYGQLTREEAVQITSEGGCIPDRGNIKPDTRSTYRNGVTTIVTNHLPNHKWQCVNPNYPKVFNETYTFSTPERLSDDEVLCLPMGSIAMAKNGAFIFNPLTGMGTNAVEEEVLDEFGGHSTPFGEYHYHAAGNTSSNLWDPSNPKSQFFGVSFDGYPIYTEGNDVDMTRLDICHGLTINGRYRYIASPNHFPYFNGCYRGKVQSTGTGRPTRQASCAGMTANSFCSCERGIQTAADLKRRAQEMGDTIRAMSEREWATKNSVSRLRCGTFSDDAVKTEFCPDVPNDLLPCPGTGGLPPGGIGGPPATGGPRPGFGPPPGMGGPPRQGMGGPGMGGPPPEIILRGDSRCNMTGQEGSSNANNNGQNGLGGYGTNVNSGQNGQANNEQTGQVGYGNNGQNGQVGYGNNGQSSWGGQNPFLALGLLLAYWRQSMPFGRRPSFGRPPNFGWSPPRRFRRPSANRWSGRWRFGG